MFWFPIQTQWKEQNFFIEYARVHALANRKLQIAGWFTMHDAPDFTRDEFSQIRAFVKIGKNLSNYSSLQ